MRRICPGWRRSSPCWKGVTPFEEGTKLVNACRKELDTAEQKVVKLSKGPDDAPVEHDFAAED